MCTCYKFVFLAGRSGLQGIRLLSQGVLTANPQLACPPIYHRSRKEVVLDK